MSREGPTTDKHGVYQHTSGTRDCPFCGKELDAYPPSNVAMHKVYRCPERPDDDQQTLGEYA